MQRAQAVRVDLRVPGTEPTPRLMGLIQSIEAADCAERIVEMSKLGVRNLYLMPLLTFARPERDIAAFRDTVFPRLSAAGLRPAPPPAT